MNVAIVTGAAGAIGRATATRLGSAGFSVLCVDRAAEVSETSSLIEAAGGSGRPFVADLTDPDVPSALVLAAKELGDPSVLVNNAGITRDGRATKMTDAEFRSVVRVNTVAPLRLGEAVAPVLADGGSIVNIASRAALGNFGQVNYVSAKAALVGATKAMAVRWAPRIRVNCVAPGLVNTPMTQAMPPEVLEKLLARVPLGRAGEPEEIADVVAFLSSGQSSYVTGQMLLTCGGRSVAG